MRTWLIRTVGTLNLLFCLGGLWYFTVRLSYSVRNHSWPGSPTRVEWLVFLVLSILTCSIVLFLGYSGVRLLRGDETAILTTMIVFSVEISYFVSGVVLFWINAPASSLHITVGFFGIARMAMDPQIIAGYPLLGLLAMFFAKPRKQVKPQSG